MGDKCKYTQNHDHSALLLGGGICLFSMGKISARTHPGPELNKACKEITGCFKASKVEDMYLLAGITLRDIRRKVFPNVERRNRKPMKLTHYLDRNQQRRACSPETVF